MPEEKINCDKRIVTVLKKFLNNLDEDTIEALYEGKASLKVYLKKKYDKDICSRGRSVLTAKT